MLEKIKKSVNRSKKILDWVGIGLGVFVIASIIFSNYIDPIFQFYLFIPLYVIFFIALLLMMFGSRNTIKETEYNNDKITFISGVFHNYLFINEDLAKKKFAVVNFYNVIKTNYNNHEIKVIYKVLKTNKRTKNYVLFYVDENRII